MTSLIANDEVQASRRARELYKYFTPPNGTLSTSKTTSPDSQLVALSQLVAYRLDCQRALISLIDRDLQYFVAEATKTVDLVDSSRYDDPDDAIWAGCVTVPSKGRLCEWTISEPAPPDGGPTIFEVLDLSKDSRFCDLGFVCGGPGFRYYVGVPLKTKRGIPIGSLFAMDVKPRQPINALCRSFMGAMAQNVMGHLESQRERVERERALNMNMCLAAFVDPEHQVWRRRKKARSRPLSMAKSTQSDKSTVRLETQEPQSTSKPPSPGAPKHSPTSPKSTDSRLKVPLSNLSDSKDEAEESSNWDSESSQKPRVDEDDHLNVFSRAATLLLDSLSLDGGGGVVFLDTNASLRKSFNNPAETSEVVPGDDTSPSGQALYRRGSVEQIQAHLKRTPSYTNEPASKGFHTQLSRQEGLADILGLSTIPVTNSDFLSFMPADLNRLVKRYPRGKIFTFEAEKIIGNSSSGDDLFIFKSPDRKHRPSKLEADLMLKHFPSSRQIIFLPLWDPATARWYCLFAYNHSSFRNFSKNPDFLYCVAFGNCLLTEIARLGTLAADQQKSDFIGSISHELRSPLHGILASCEFLDDTKLDSFQQSLITTADSCARTLLDTINMVLDYSKINSFERNASKARKSKGSNGKFSEGLQQPLMNIYGDVNLAAITEEVVEGVATGQVFRDSLTSFDTRDIQFDSNARTVDRNLTRKSLAAQRADVELVLEIISEKDWTYVTQPGAFRRVVMNLFGNALKYTKSGFIRVRLEIEDLQKQRTMSSATVGYDEYLAQSTASLDAIEPEPTTNDSTQVIKLTITDSGIGMSPEYLRTKLFIPFAQESSLAPGTGLGLSLVKSIVEMLKGSIDFKSALGVGTEVTVKFPMPRSTSGGTNTNSTPSSTGSGLDRIQDDSIDIIRKLAIEKAAALYWDITSEPTAELAETAHMVRHTVAHYLTEWFDFGSVLDWNPSITADLIIVDEMDVASLKKAVPVIFKPFCKIMVLVLCNTASRQASTDKYSGLGNFEAICHPFGPFKLAKALRLVMERNEAMGTSLPTPLPEIISEQRRQDPLEQVVRATEQVTLSANSPGLPEINVLKQGSALANEDSMNARMALDGFSPAVSSVVTESKEGFPFPSQDGSSGTTSSIGEIITSPEFIPLPETPGPRVPGQRTPGPLSPGAITSGPKSPTTPGPRSPGIRTSGPRTPGPITLRPQLPDKAQKSYKSEPKVNESSATSSTTIVDTTANVSTASQASISTPRMLLVDDNAVNLRLLQTFMKKRKYTQVTSATDGQQAVDAFEYMTNKDPSEPPEIIFMDISMPVMNGFEAIRRIRAIEAECREQLPAMQTPAQCLIIALTGLASGRDQTEAFTSGCDLFLNKPISFREVGRLLDNWQSNGGSSGTGIPHGSIASAEGSPANA